MPSEEEHSLKSAPPENSLRPIVGRGENGNIMIVNGRRAASLINGQWQPGILFEKHEIDEFRQIRNKEEIQTLLNQAEDALNKSLEE